MAFSLPGRKSVKFRTEKFLPRRKGSTPRALKKNIGLIPTEKKYWQTLAVAQPILPLVEQKARTAKPMTNLIPFSRGVPIVIPGFLCVEYLTPYSSY
jgi:hypothetical protein